MAEETTNSTEPTDDMATESPKTHRLPSNRDKFFLKLYGDLTSLPKAEPEAITKSDPERKKPGKRLKQPSTHRQFFFKLYGDLDTKDKEEALEESPSFAETATRKTRAPSFEGNATCKTRAPSFEENATHRASPEPRGPPEVGSQFWYNQVLLPAATGSGDERPETEMRRLFPVSCGLDAVDPVSLEYLAAQRLEQSHTFLKSFSHPGFTSRFSAFRKFHNFLS